MIDNNNKNDSNNNNNKDSNYNSNNNQKNEEKSSNFLTNFKEVGVSPSTFLTKWDKDKMVILIPMNNNIYITSIS